MRGTLLLASLGMFASLAVAKAQDPDLQGLLGKENKQINDAMIKGDLTPVLGMLSPSMMITNPVGGFLSRDELVRSIQTGMLHYTSFEPSDWKLVQYGDFAVLAFRSREAGTMQGHNISGDYRYTQVWAKQDGQWRIVAIQLTAIAPEGH